MSEGTKLLLIKYGGAVAIFIVGIVLMKIILKLERKALERSSLDEALYMFIMNASKIALWVILIVTMLAQLDVPTAPLVTVLGACGAAVALALRDSLSNVAGGIIILVNKPFIKGDTIDVNGTVGVVDHIDLLTSQLHTFDNKIVTVPNGTITNNILINRTSQDIRRVDCKFNIGYDDDIEAVKSILLEVAKSSDMILDDPEPVIGVSEHGSNAIVVDALIWCITENYYDVGYFYQEQVKLAFDKAGINIPYPQVDIHMVK